MVKKGTSGGECYGAYSSSTGYSGGGGFFYSCIHSGANEGSSGSTVWYNYAAASAGIITNLSTSGDYIGNTNVATESICPKGWTLPSQKQINKNTNITTFSPVLGGGYTNGTLNNESTRGYWWSSDAKDAPQRRMLNYNSTDAELYLATYGRNYGIYIRCVSEEKDVSDLTYMQDMTPSVATFTAASPHHPSRTLCHSECIKSLIL